MTMVKLRENIIFQKEASRYIVIYIVPAGNKIYRDRSADEYAHIYVYRVAVSSICVLVVFVRYYIVF